MRRSISIVAVWVIIYLFALPFVFTVSSAYAQKVNIDRLDIVDYGIYTAEVISAQRDSQGLLQTKSSKIQHVKMTRDIPAQIGVRFGFRFKVVGTPSGAEVNLKKIVIFPPNGLLNPNSNSTINRSENTIAMMVGGETIYTAYKFDDPWELSAGVWTIELWYGDRKLTSQSFTVFKP